VTLSTSTDSNTAITRLYQSLDPSQPTVFHGNTCVHEINVSPTAAIPLTLLLTDLLSVIYVPSKFKPEYPGNTYKIRKPGVRGFLQWLKYTMGWDNRSDGEDVFKEGTSRMSDYPAKLFNVPLESSDRRT